MNRKLNILICPLDWGLGHATRDIPVIKYLQGRGHNVIVAAGKNPLKVILSEIPDIDFIPFESITINYPSRGSMFFHFLKLLPRLMMSIRREHIKLKKIIRNRKIDIVISDNRFGLWNNAVYSVFITHQIFIRLPRPVKFLEWIIYRINWFFISKYDKCWVPDYKDMPHLAGELAHKHPLNGNTAFIGLLSRFAIPGPEQENSFNEKFDIMAIISGPEPHRTGFEEMLLSQMQSLSYKCLLVRGKPDTIQQREVIGNIVVYSHLNTLQMKSAILNSTYLICRSGYSTIMDLIALRRTAVLVPTPGQTEQEYLSEYFNLRKMFVAIKQSEFNINNALSRISVYSSINLNIEDTFLAAEVEKLEAVFNNE